MFEGNISLHKASPGPTICWDCQTLMPGAYLACNLCHKLQPPTPLNPFERLGLPPALEMDLASLESAYIRTVSLCHPDRYLQCAVQKDHGEGHMAALNEAYNTLKDFLSRSIALYTCTFGSYQEENIPCASLFLMEIFDLQDEAEHLQEEEELTSFREKVQRLTAQAQTALTQAFEVKDATLARRHIQALQYLRKLAKLPLERSHAASNL